MTITSLKKTQEDLSGDKRRQMAKAMQEQNLLLVIFDIEKMQH